MKVIRQLEQVTSLKDTIVTTGTFDGVHLGHQKIFDAMLKQSHNTGQKTVVITFHPHPRLVLKKEPEKLYLLATIHEKIELIEKSGIDYLVILEFNKELASMSPEDFICKILITKLGAHTIFVGYDHQFGKGKSGSKDTLKEVSCKHHFIVKEVDALSKNNQVISSSIIRELIIKGKIEEAAQKLGYKYRITGKVVKGNMLGRKIGFPTANIESKEKLKLIPARGVYAVRVYINNQWHKGMLNIGFRPTLNTTKATVEVHVFDLNANLYDVELTIEFIKFLRNEIKFENLQSLSNQLKKDKEKAIQILG